MMRPCAIVRRSPVGAVAAVSNDHRSCAHHGALRDRVERRDEQDHLGEDQENTRDQEQVLPRVRVAQGLRTSVLGDL